MNKIKIYAILLLTVFIFDLLSRPLMAVTGGPSQPEVEGFQAIDVSSLVDPLTGDFSYNIPLFDLGGYPINLAYNANPNMEQEASWVGLGWTLNPGAINRDVRGVPDDFNGIGVKRDYNIRNNYTIGVSGNVSGELFGVDNLSGSASATLTYNNYNGIGIETGVNVSAGLKTSQNSSTSFSGGIGLSTGPNGAGVNTSLGLKIGETNQLNIGLNGSMNTRDGLNQMGFNAAYQKNSKKADQVYKKQNDLMESKGAQGKMSSKKIDETYSSSTPLLGNSVSFNNSPSMPQGGYKMVSRNYSGRVTIGAEAFGMHPNFGIRAFYSDQRLKSNGHTDESYGCLYLENAKNKEVILDYNKEKETALGKHTTHLPLPYLSQDLFNVSGQGITGQFKIKRADNGILHHKHLENNNVGNNIGGEIGAANLWHLGADISRALSSSKNSKWENLNLMQTLGAFMDYSTSDNNNRNFQPRFFQNTQEMFFSQIDELNELKPIRPKYQVFGDNQMLVSTEYTDNKTILDQKQDQRSPNNILMTYLTVKEASSTGFDKSIKNYNILHSNNSFNPAQAFNYSNINRNAQLDNDQISEILINNNDGNRYIYGIPAVNAKKVEATFNVDISPSHQDSLYIEYDYNVDNSKNNNKGRDHFFDRTETPSYAYSYLLTSIISPDYVDVTNDGLTEDDIGNAVKFNYSRIFSNFKWRMPYEANSANHHPGHKLLENDSKGSYIYGEKEVWYLHSIESKNQVALFFLDDRCDCLETQGENGGPGNNTQKKLKEIRIYAKADLLANSSNAIPIKTIHFTYDYSLHKGVVNRKAHCDVNGGNGKLTLKEVWFTYGKSKKGEKNKYKFSYQTKINGNEATYNSTHVDRWGNYKMPSILIPNHIYPHTEQNKHLQDQYAAWGSLIKIELPSGGQIDIDYESDAYSFVQNYAVGDMYKIVGFGQPNQDKLNNWSSINIIPVNSVIVEVENEMSIEEFRTRILSRLNKMLYFDLHVNLGNANVGPSQYDRVTGYAEITGSSHYPHPNSNKYFVINFKSAYDGGNQFNPLSIAALQKLRREIPEKAYPGSYLDIANPDPLNLISFLGSQVLQIADMVVGFNKLRITTNYCNRVDLIRSFVRLMDEDQIRLGGGNRVKRLTISDRINVEYYKQVSGQAFEYLTEEGKCSGVATYEPSIGGDVNLMKYPHTQIEKRLLTTNNFYYQDGPFGEDLLPSPSIGYSRVTIRPFVINNNNEYSETGTTEHHFYTAKDYPVYLKETNIEMKHNLNKGLKKLFNFSRKSFFQALQGYLIVVNDMHGKPKMNIVRNAEGAIMEKTEYKYENLQGAPVKMVSNKVNYVDRLGNIQEGILGMDREIYQEMNENHVSSSTPGIMCNSDGFMIGPIPVPTIVPLNLFANNDQYTRTGVVTKFIRKSGIVSEVINTKNGAVTKQKNLLYDKETAQVVLSSVTNAHGDLIYNTEIPAYWQYEKMGPAYHNGGLYIKNIDVGNDNGIVLQHMNGILNEGDEIQVIHISGQSQAYSQLKYYVIRAFQNPEHLRLVDNLSKPLPNGNYHLKVIRSGNRNHLNDRITSIVSLDNPISNNELRIDELSKVINATAITYHDYSKINCDKQLIFDENYVTFCDRSQAMERMAILPQDPAECDNLNLNIGYLIDAILTYKRAGINNQQIETLSDLFSFYRNQLLYPSDFDANITDIESTFNYSEISPISSSVERVFDIHLDNCLLEFKLNRIGTFFNYLADKPVFTIAQENIYGNFTPSFGMPYPTAGTGLILNYVPEEIPGQTHAMYHIGFVNDEGEIIKIGEVTYSCLNRSSSCIALEIDSKINPYAKGLKGNWKPKRSYTYLDERVATRANNYLNADKTNVRVDGYFKNWTSFWKFDNNGVSRNSTSDIIDKWKWDSEITLTDNRNNALEQVDPLSRFSSALFSYNNWLNTAVASNARHQQIAFDHFEDYYFDQDGNEPCHADHFNFRDIIDNIPGVSISYQDAHSGIASMKIEPSYSITINRKIEHYDYRGVNNLYDDENDPDEVLFEKKFGTLTKNIHGDFILRQSDCLKKFSPTTGKYVISCWAKREKPCDLGASLNVPIRVGYAENSNEIAVFLPSGPLIDGWQRYEGVFEFTVDEQSTQDEFFYLTISNDDSYNVFIDDLRIHPFNSNMKSFVFHPYNLRLMATLDENNYATFYHYDAEGKLVRVNKETERGIVTLKEHRQEMIKTIQ